RIAPDASLPVRSVPVGNINDHGRFLFQTLGAHIGYHADHFEPVRPRLVADPLSHCILSRPDIARSALGHYDHLVRPVAFCGEASTAQRDIHGFEIMLADKTKMGQWP